MSLITFAVVDTTCEASLPNNIPPKALLTAVSTTQVATVLGYPEWKGLESKPPKKFHNLTWNGTSEHQLWIGPTNVPANQIGGARYDYSGTDTVDTHGNITGTHTKNLNTQCNGSFGLYAEVQGNQAGTGESILYSFRGYWGVASVAHPEFIAANPSLFSPTLRLCVASTIPYGLIGNMAVNGESDHSDLWGSAKVSGTSNLGVSNFAGVNNTLAQSVETGTDGRLAMPYLQKIGTTADQTSPPFDYWQSCSIVYDHNYSATLSNEYTDAEALSNALVTTANSTIAQNLPRTTGFVSTFTQVAFTLNCSNLIGGKSYTASVEFFDATTGVTSTKNYTVNATGSTATVNDTVPTPAAGHTLQVRHPKIALAP